VAFQDEEFDAPRYVARHFVIGVEFAINQNSARVRDDFDVSNILQLLGFPTAP
jgi:hypothetical protein